MVRDVSHLEGGIAEYVGKFSFLALCFIGKSSMYWEVRITGFYWGRVGCLGGLRELEAEVSWRSINAKPLFYPMMFRGIKTLPKAIC